MAVAFATATATVTATAWAAPVANASYGTPIVDYGSGFAVVSANTAGDIVLFTQPFGSNSWTKRYISKTRRGDPAVNYVAVATNGDGTLAVIGSDESDVVGHLYSWIGTVTGPFTEAVIDDSATLHFQPSVTYSSAGSNFLVTASDLSGGFDYWYSTTTSGGWRYQQIADDNNELDPVITTTDKGVVIVAEALNGGLLSYYQPYLTSRWTQASSILIGETFSLSIVWSGTDVLVAANNYDSTKRTNYIDVLTYSDVGAYISNAVAGSSSNGEGAFSTGIVWTGLNVGVVAKFSDGPLAFFYSDTNFAFHQETVRPSDTDLAYGVSPSIAVGNNTLMIADATEGGSGLYGYSQPNGGVVWAKHTIVAG